MTLYMLNRKDISYRNIFSINMNITIPSGTHNFARIVINFHCSRSIFVSQLNIRCFIINRYAQLGNCFVNIPRTPIKWPTGPLSQALLAVSVCSFAFMVIVVYLPSDLAEALLKSDATSLLYAPGTPSEALEFLDSALLMFELNLLTRFAIAPSPLKSPTRERVCFFCVFVILSAAAL